MPVSSIPSSWCEIHCDRISSNLELALEMVPDGVAFCAVMKADAYGHGISRVVPLLLEQGVDCIGITSNAEARAVRDAGFAGRLIRLRAATPQEILQALTDRVEEQVGSREAARQLHQIRRDSAAPAGVHLALNCAGMSRDGLEISTDSGRQDCLNILEEIGQHVVGICTHFPTNTPMPLRQTSDQFKREVAWICDNSDMTRSDLLVHAGSTLTLLSAEQVETDMYRCGAILYGILSPERGFRPTMELKSRVVHLGNYPKGATVGYDCERHLEADRRLACISIGYAAGYSRFAQDCGAVLIRGRRAPVLGKVSMNSIVADITEICDAQVGDEATVFGGNGSNAIGPDAAVSQFGTILPDLFSDWGMRNPRTYLC